MNAITASQRSGQARPDIAAGRLISAEFLKVRKRRGLSVLTALLTVGAVVAAGSVLVVLHMANPAKNGPAGGISSLGNIGYIVSSLSVAAGVLVGATMGAGDLAAGVFRDLVATGRSRLTLFLVRVPGGLALLWPLVAASWAVACAGAVLLAGSHPRPGAAVMAEGVAWLLVTATAAYLVGLGLAALTGSLAVAVGIVLAWQLAVTPLLLHITKLGALREGLLTAGLNRLIPAGLLPGGRPDPVSPFMSVTLAITVVAAWSLLPLAAGAWRTCTRDA